MALLTDEELLETLEIQLPALLKRHPELETRAYMAFIEAFATKKEVAAVLSELHAFRGEFGQFRSEVNERFEKVDERFDQVDERFEKVDEQFKKVDERFEKVDERFDQVDERLEKVDERFEKVDEQFDQVKQQMAETKDRTDKLALAVGGFQRRAGRKLEDVVAGALRYGLKRQDVSADNVRLRQKLVDVEGVVGPAGRTYEVDILIDNSSLLVFEVKSAACKVEEVDRFADKVELVRRQHPDKAVEGALISLEPANTVKARCAEWGIQIL